MLPIKLVLIALLIFIAAVSCKRSNEQIMKDKIADNYTSTANEALFEGYNPVSFGKIDTIYSSIETDTAYVRLTNLANKISLKINEIVFKRNSKLIDKKNADRKLRLLYDRLDSVSANRENIKKTFQKSIIGYSMKHTFNIKNKVTGKNIQPTILVVYHDNLLIKDIIVLKE
ncbi:MAG: hypothetical protein JWN56_3078 [Sphingobacteriales bacterium]|nr:hypothetical protein [Sphingobacteriales bacterium]